MPARTKCHKLATGPRKLRRREDKDRGGALDLLKVIHFPDQDLGVALAKLDGCATSIMWRIAMALRRERLTKPSAAADAPSALVDDDKVLVLARWVIVMSSSGRAEAWGDPPRMPRRRTPLAGPHPT